MSKQKNKKIKLNIKKLFDDYRIKPKEYDCPKCGSKMKRKDIICQECGYNVEIPNGIPIIIALIIVVAIIVSCTVGIIVKNANNAYLTTNAYSTTQNYQTNRNDENAYGNKELDTILKSMPLYVSASEIISLNTEDGNTSNLIKAYVTNQSETNIRSFVVAFCAWDSNGNPINIIQPNESPSGFYVRTVNYVMSVQNDGSEYLSPGQTCENVLIQLDDSMNISRIEACIKSYTDYHGNSWTNPYYSDFKINYAGKQLEEIPNNGNGTVIEDSDSIEGSDDN